MKLVPLGEPCAMCTGAMIQARLKKVVIGTMDEKTGACGSVLNLLEDYKFNHVVEVGPGAVVDGVKVPMEVKAGDRVIYSKYAGTEVKLGDDEYIIVKQSDILAVVSE